MQRLSRDNVRRIFDEHEKLNHELETKKKKLDSWSKQKVIYGNVAFPNNQIFFFSINKIFL